MAVGTIEFYAMPGSLSTGEYPILSPDQDVSGYLVESVPKCKYTKDLLQAVGPMAIFDDYDTVNMAKIENDWYWVVDWTTQSLQSESVIFGLSYNAPTSQLRLGQTITGNFVKTPVNLCPYMTNTIITDAMEYSRHVDLPHMAPYITIDPRIEREPTDIHTETGTYKLYWLEIVSTKDTVSGSNSRMTKYGMFVALDDDLNQVRVCCRMINNPLSTQSPVIEQYYPMLSEVINNPESTLGINADTILQIAISERCPYAHTIRIEATVSQTSVVYYQYYRTVRLDNYTPPSTSGYAIYVDNSGAVKWDAPEISINMTLDEMERMTGSMRILNESGTVIATVPNQYGASVTLAGRTISDYSGIYTELLYDGRLLCTIPEGHVPWVGDAWIQYASRQLEADRELVAIANNQVRMDLDHSLQQSMIDQRLNQINAVANVGLFNAISGATSAALTIAESAIKGQVERQIEREKTAFQIDRNETEQQLREKMIMNEPGTAYSVGYGLIYIYQTLEHPASLRLEMPSNLTQAYYENHVAKFGYPAEGLLSFQIQNGYIQGRIYDSNVSGRKLDELNSVLKNGFLIRSII